MPQGSHNEVVGSSVYFAIKLVGYIAAAKVISNVYGKSNLNTYVVGGTRALIGLVFGMLFVAAFGRSGAVQILEIGGPFFLLYLIPIRFIEWWLLIWLFYDRALVRRKLGWSVAAVGTVWSFILDIPAILGVIVIGGFWVC
jgi:hypothetical protein